jgi:hypothetical protein
MGYSGSDIEVAGGLGDRSDLVDSMKDPAASRTCCHTYNLTQSTDGIEDRLLADSVAIRGGLPIMGILY